MVKLKTWISLEGGYFEGSLAALCREMGIKHGHTVKRKSGAPDRDGDRWMSEEQYNTMGFTKPTLYLGMRQVKDKHTGRMTLVESSGAGSLYLMVKGMVADMKPDHCPKHREMLEGVINSYEKIYEIVDNSEIKGDDHHLKYLERELDWWNQAHNTLHMQHSYAGVFFEHWTFKAHCQYEDVKEYRQILFQLVYAERDRLAAYKQRIKLERAEIVHQKDMAFLQARKDFRAENGTEPTLDDQVAMCNELGHTPFYVKRWVREKKKELKNSMA